MSVACHRVGQGWPGPRCHLSPDSAGPALSCELCPSVPAFSDPGWTLGWGAFLVANADPCPGQPTTFHSRGMRWIFPVGTRAQTSSSILQPVGMTWDPSEASVGGGVEEGGTVGTMRERSLVPSPPRCPFWPWVASVSPSVKWALTPCPGVTDSRLTLTHTAHKGLSSPPPVSAHRMLTDTELLS